MFRVLHQLPQFTFADFNSFYLFSDALCSSEARSSFGLSVAVLSSPWALSDHMLSVGNVLCPCLSCNSYLVSTCYVPALVLSSGDAKLKQHRQNPCSTSPNYFFLPNQVKCVSPYTPSWKNFFFFLFL